MLKRISREEITEFWVGKGFSRKGAEALTDHLLFKEAMGQEMVIDELEYDEFTSYQQAGIVYGLRMSSEELREHFKRSTEVLEGVWGVIIKYPEFQSTPNT
jgi:hypothetical protein